MIDRRSLTGTNLEGDEVLANLRWIFEDRRSRWQWDVLATRGERLALFRCRWVRSEADAVLAEVEYVEIVEVDSSGRQVLGVEFDPDDLDAACAELDRRFSAGEGAPYATLLARLGDFARASKERDLDPFARAVGEGFTHTSHRRFASTGTVLDREAWLAARGSFETLGKDLGLRDEKFQLDHLRVSPTTLLRAFTWTGTRDGGPFEIPLVYVEAHDGAQLLSQEVYDLEQLDAALARYEELSRAPAPTPRLENAATRSGERFEDALRTHDWEGATAICAREYRHVDERGTVQLDLDRDQYFESLRLVFAMQSSRHERRVLAPRGDRLALVQMLWSGSDRSVGPSELEWLSVQEVNAAGDRVATVAFDVDDLDAAYEERDARYGAAAGPAFFRDIYARDWDAVAARLAPDLVVEDHRRLGWETLHGAAAYLAVLRDLVELARDVRVRTDHAEESDRGALMIVATLGTREGGAFEIPRIVVLERDAQARARRIDIYDLDQLTLARARLAAIGARAPRDPLAALAKPNAATAARNRVDAAFAARDWAALRALCVPDAKFDDRVLATSGPLGGRSEIEHLSLTEVDENGRIVASVAFDLDDWRAAHREGLGRWLARDPETAAAMSPSIELVEAVNDRDRARVRALLADDVVVHDHRLVSMDEVVGADAYLPTLEVMWNLARDIQLGPWCVLARERHGGVAAARAFGTLSEGGALENY